MVNDRELELREQLKADPGHECAVELVELLNSGGRASEAISVALAGLTTFPSFYKLRLLLAKVLFEAGYRPFAAREISELCSAMPENRALIKLRDELAPGNTFATISESEDSTVAEISFETEEIDILSQSKK